MATKLYLPSSGSILTPGGVTPTFSASWNTTTPVGWYAAVTSKISSSMVNLDTYADSTSGMRKSGRVSYVYGPLAASPVIQGTVTGQMRCSENNASFNGTWCMTIRTMYYSGGAWGVRGTNLALDPATPTASPPEFASPVTTMVNRQYRQTTSNTIGPTLTNVSPTAGDYLVIEMGVNEVGTTTSRYGRLVIGDNSASDLAVDDTTSTANNPFISFTTDLPILCQILKGSLAATSTTAGAIKYLRNLAGTIATQSGVSGNLGVLQKIRGNVGRPSPNLLTTNQARGTDSTGDTTGFINNFPTHVTISSSAAEAQEGTKSLKIDWDASTVGYEGPYLTANVDSSTTYTLTFYQKGPSDSTTYRCWVFEGTGTTGLGYTIYTGPFNDWTRVTVTFTTLSDTTSMEGHFYQVTDLAAKTAYIDGIQLEKYPEASSWMAPSTMSYGGQSTAVGAIQYLRKLAGSTGSTATTTGVLTKASITPLAGVIGTQSTTTGVLKPTFKLAGAIATQSTTTGVLKPTFKLVGVVATQSTVVAALRQRWKITGIIGTQSTLVANLGDRYKVLGVIGTQSTVVAALRQRWKITSVIGTQSTTAGVLKPKFKLSGAIGTQSTTTGVLKPTFKLVGVIATQSTVVAALRQRWKITGLVVTQSTTAGVLKPRFKLSGIVATQSTTTANVSDKYRVTGIIAGQLSTSPTLSVAKAGLYFAGIIQNQSTTTATLKVGWKLTGSLSGQLSTTSILGVRYKVLGTIIGQSTLISQLNIVHRLAGIIGGQSTTTPKINVAWKIKSITSGLSTVTATLSVGGAYSLLGVINFNSTLTATLIRRQPVIGVVSSLTTTHGLIYLIHNITATSTATSSLTGLIYITWTLGGTTRGTLYLLAGLAGGTYREPDENSKAMWTLRHPPPVMVMGESTGHENIAHARGRIGIRK